MHGPNFGVRSEAFLVSVEDFDGQLSNLRKQEIISGRDWLYIIYLENAEEKIREIASYKNARKIVDGKTMKSAYLLKTDAGKNMYMTSNEECIVMAGKMNILDMMHDSYNGTRESMEYKIEELLAENVQKDADHIFLVFFRDISRAMREQSGDEEWLNALDRDLFGILETQITEHKIEAEIKEKHTSIYSNEESVNEAVNRYRKGNLENSQGGAGKDHKGWRRHTVKTIVDKNKLIEEALYRKPVREKKKQLAS